MNKAEAENYLLDKYTDLIYEYSGLHRKGLKNKRNNRIDLGIMVLKVFRKKMSILTSYFILKWINASCIMGGLLCQKVGYGVTLSHTPGAQSGIDRG